MSPSDKEGTDGPSEGAAPAPPGIRLRKTLGAAGIIIGSGLVVTMPFLDYLNGIRVSGALSAQDLGILAGFAILLTGMLLYLGSIISHMEHRHRGLEQRIEGLLEASEGEPGTGPDRTSMKKAAAAEIAGADEAPPASAADRPAEEPAPAPPAEEPAVASPPPGPAMAAEQKEVPVPVQPTEPAGPAVSGAAPSAGTDCPVCGNELTGGVCRHCITSSSIQSAYQELSRTKELGASVEEAAALLGNARNSLEEKDYLEAGEYVRNSRYLLEISAKTYFALRSAVDKAEAERRKLQDSGLDTTELSSKLSDVRSAIVRGEYQESKTLLDEEHSAAADLRLPYFQRPARAAAVEGARPDEAPKRPAPGAPAAEPPAVPPPSPAGTAVPKFSSGISACPKCGRKTMKGWKKCPHCLATLK
jgi:hypothetical protein